MIGLSSPVSYIFWLTLGLIVFNLIIALKERHFYKFTDFRANLLLILVGICAALSFIGISFGYKLLPLGVVASIISSKTFISLWLSHKKYKEKDLSTKFLASSVAFVGIMVLFLVH